MAAARERQNRRFAETPWGVNADVPGSDLRRRWPVHPEGRELIDAQMRGRALNPRSADRVLRLAWTAADLAGHDTPTVDDVEAGLALRRGTPLGGPVRDLVQAS